MLRVAEWLLHQMRKDNNRDLQRGLMKALQIHQRLHRALLHHQRLHCRGANQRQGSEGADGGGGGRDEGAGGSAAPSSARGAKYEESEQIS